MARRRSRRRRARGALFKYGRRELGHLHGDHAADFSFPRSTWHELRDAGRIDFHPVFPGKSGPGQRRIETDADVVDVVELFRDQLRPWGGTRAARSPAGSGEWGSPELTEALEPGVSVAQCRRPYRVEAAGTVGAHGGEARVTQDAEVL